MHICWWTTGKCEIGDVEEDIIPQGDFMKDAVTEIQEDDDDDQETRSALTSLSTNNRTVAAKRVPLTPAKQPYTRFPGTGQVVDQLSTLVRSKNYGMNARIAKRNNGTNTRTAEPNTKPPLETELTTV
jgi:hypothetical protein